jgi:hypothetical protein
MTVETGSGVFYPFPATKQSSRGEEETLFITWEWILPGNKITVLFRRNKGYLNVKIVTKDCPTKETSVITWEWILLGNKIFKW